MFLNKIVLKGKLEGPCKNYIFSLQGYNELKEKWFIVNSVGSRKKKLKRGNKCTKKKTRCKNAFVVPKCLLFSISRIFLVYKLSYSFVSHLVFLDILIFLLFFNSEDIFELYCTVNPYQIHIDFRIWIQDFSLLYYYEPGMTLCLLFGETYNGRTTQFAFIRNLLYGCTSPPDWLQRSKTFSFKALANPAAPNYITAYCTCSIALSRLYFGIVVFPN